MLGRPTRATLCTVASLCTKSTVTASCSPGAEGLLQMWPRDVAEVEAAEHEASELQEAGAEAVAAGRRHVLDEASVCERGQEPRHRARVDARAAGDLVRTELGTLVGERIEH